MSPSLIIAIILVLADFIIWEFARDSVKKRIAIFIITRYRKALIRKLRKQWRDDVFYDNLTNSKHIDANRSHIRRVEKLKQKWQGVGIKKKKRRPFKFGQLKIIKALKYIK